MRSRFGLMIFAACALWRADAGATNYTFSTTLDTSTAVVAPFLLGLQTVSLSIVGAPTFVMSAGDTLSGTITLTQPLFVEGPLSFPFPLVDLNFNCSGCLAADGDEHMLISGVSGQLDASNPSNNVFSNFIINDVIDFGVTNSFVSFLSLDYSITISGFPSGGTSELFTPSELFIDDPAGSSITAAPEPSSIAAFGAGLVGLGMIRRRRTAQ